MAKRIKVSELAEFDASEYLNGDENVAAYLTAVLEHMPAHSPSSPGPTHSVA
ncbi:hypothetical protein [Thiomonas sp. FB-Cd]|uniref:hypothetical protein n=1 Tax=Thiomonas sp. FB-Cd TaxID=1158292 RepID=UPI000AF13827|nr:hypothetical protein [Thiomonas sp. FB-Cd]